MALNKTSQTKLHQAIMWLLMCIVLLLCNMTFAQRTIFELDPVKIKSIEVLNITQQEMDSLKTKHPERYTGNISAYKKSKYIYLDDNGIETVQIYYTDTSLMNKIPVERLRREIERIGRGNVSWYNYKNLAEADLKHLRKTDLITFKDKSVNYRSITIYYTKNGNAEEYTYYEKY